MDGSYDSVKEAINLGAFAYLEKLSDRSELLRHVHRACRERVDHYAPDLERAVAARTEELARSNRELEDFASIVAHDLRSPLLTISGYCQLIQEDYGEQLDATAHDYLGQVLAGAARMDRLIDDLLEYSRAGRSRQPFGQVDMQSVLVQATANLEAAIRQRERGSRSAPCPRSPAIRPSWSQLFQNLIGNAVKFCRRRRRGSASIASPDGGCWRFAVKDNGIGIDGALRAHFPDLPAAAWPEEYPGTGVGLAICKKIVERHGGRIWMDSAVGEGTTFYFTLAEQAIESCFDCGTNHSFSLACSK